MMTPWSTNLLALLRKDRRYIPLRHFLKGSLYNPLYEVTGNGAEKEHDLITDTCLSLAAFGSTQTHTQCMSVPPTHRCLKLTRDSSYRRNNHLNITTTITYIYRDMIPTKPEE
jgi:hypothetical protein